VTGILERIVAAVESRLEADPAPPDLEARARAAAAGRARRSLEGALAAPGIRIIAEIKRRSPSAGPLREPFDPLALAAAYAAAGAAAISVVSEPDFFAGEPAWIGAVRGATTVPVLRKDFIVAERQLYESVLLGADAVLLIAAALPPPRLVTLAATAAGLGLDVLLEVHDEEELDLAVDARVVLVGVNARDLRSFRVDVAAAARLAERLPADRVAVIESGIHDGRQVAELAARGLRRFLVGEHLVRATEPGNALRALLGSGPRGPAEVGSGPC